MAVGPACPRCSDDLYVMCDVKGDKYLETKNVLSEPLKHWPTIKTETVLHDMSVMAISFDTDDLYCMICGDKELALGT